MIEHSGIESLQDLESTGGTMGTAVVKLVDRAGVGASGTVVEDALGSTSWQL